MSDLETQFKEAAERAANPPVELDNTQRLRFYGLYKQATLGDVTTDRPGIFSPTDRAKWDAYKECEGMDKEAAMKAYIEFTEECFK